MNVFTMRRYFIKISMDVLDDALLDGEVRTCTKGGWVGKWEAECRSSGLKTHQGRSCCLKVPSAWTPLQSDGKQLYNISDMTLRKHI